MLDTVKINHVQHISFTQSRLTDAVSVILSELLSYEHPSKGADFYFSLSSSYTGFPFVCSKHFSCFWHRVLVPREYSPAALLSPYGVSIFFK